MKKIIFLLFVFITPLLAQVPGGFVNVKEFIPSVVLDLRYATEHNFLGVKVDGYEAYKCYLTKKAATALKKVQDELLKKGYSLKIYDAYRPQRAVDHFIRWAKAIDDTLTKKEFYPTIDKKNLFSGGFIAGKSGHSRGSTVDLTIVPLPLLEQEQYTPGMDLCECYLPAEMRFKDNSIDMGTGFDCFHENSATNTRNIGDPQHRNRIMLKSIMEKYGFINYDQEWWHYTLRNEPFPNTYFDFVIK